MKNTIGKNVAITLFGESHGDMIGCVLDGVCAGVSIDMEFMLKQLDKRKPQGSISTARKESDMPKIVSGVFEGKTTGTPITILMENQDQKSKDYSALKDVARPSHADYVANIKYHGYQDYRGGGHFSGRLTAPIVAAGAVALQLLQQKGIFIGTHILQLYNVFDDAFSSNAEELKCEIDKVNAMYFAVLNDYIGQKMEETIELARLQQDSVGGVLESAIVGLPSGIGEPFFDSLESVISHYLFSIGGIKGIEFGSGFSFANMYGSCANDAFRNERGNVVTTTNHNGGINGGISNGMPILVKTVVKPTPSIAKEQETINMKTLENTTVAIHGRHDPAIIHRARVVQDSLLALALVDMLTEVYGTSWWMPCMD